MSSFITNSSIESPSEQIRHTSKPKAWYRPTISPEHGVYVVLLVSFLTGAAATQHWHWKTTIALICAFCGFQAEHPLVLQIKQRKSLKPRFLIWGGVYTGIAVTIALFLYLTLDIDARTPLLWIYLGAIVAFAMDAISVFYREQKSILNEVITFAAVCLSTPFAYVVTTGTLSTAAVGLWILNTLFFSSTIFAVKFRKSKTHSVAPGVTYHTIASLIIMIFWYLSWLTPIAALAFGIALLKFGFILWQQEWYCSTKIQHIAMLETLSSLGFLVIAALSVLPVHL
ncbi:MAG: hypothetical protein HC769_27985 [Cyanobacteria bacterium CRU_2_1]|nr:hypothetical protein [Cyanobacteria bacterium RU_5_0]NJR62322.1 hypothetical protein [Cyanobacteria bacterium CRU_2_1]